MKLKQKETIMVTWDALARTIQKFRDEAVRQHKRERERAAELAVRRARKRKNAET